MRKQNTCPVVQTILIMTAEASDASQGELSQYVNYVKSPKGGRKVMGEFEKYFREEGRKAGVEEGETKERLSNVKAIMDSLKVSALEAMNILKFSPEEQQKLLPLL